MKWRIYYSDGTILNGETSKEAFAAPTMGALLLKQEADNWRGYSLRHGFIFLCWERITLSDGSFNGEWRWGGKDDLIGLTDYYSYHKGAQKVLVGREIHDDTYQEISKKAALDGCLCTTPCEHKV